MTVTDGNIANDFGTNTDSIENQYGNDPGSNLETSGKEAGRRRERAFPLQLHFLAEPY